MNVEGKPFFLPDGEPTQEIEPKSSLTFLERLFLYYFLTYRFAKKETGGSGDAGIISEELAESELKKIRLFLICAIFREARRSFNG